MFDPIQRRKLPLFEIQPCSRFRSNLYLLAWLRDPLQGCADAAAAASMTSAHQDFAWSMTLPLLQASLLLHDGHLVFSSLGQLIAAVSA